MRGTAVWRRTTLFKELDGGVVITEEISVKTEETNEACSSREHEDQQPCFERRVTA